MIEPQEPLVFVEVLETEGYVPKVYVDLKISRVSCVNKDGKYEIQCSLSDDLSCRYILDNPAVESITATLHFENKNTNGKTIRRAFTLMRPLKDKTEEMAWTAFKYQLI